MTFSHYVAIATAVVGGWLSSAIVGVGPPQSQQRFLSGVDVVTMYMIAVDKSGNGIRDLAAGDLILKVDGKPRLIRTLDPVTLTASQVSGQTASGGSATGFRQFSRSFVFVIVHEHIRAGNEQPFVTAAAGFVKLLQPADRVAVVTLPQGRIELNLTDDHDRLSTVLGGLRGHSRGPVANGTCYEGSALRDFIDGLKEVAGPKYVLVLSEGLSYCGGENPREQLRAIAEAADVSNSFLTVVRPYNMPVDASVARRSGLDMDDRYQAMANQSVALRNLAGATNGDYFELTGKADGVLGDIERRTRGAYLLAFDATSEDLTRATIDISLRSVRKKVGLRYPSHLKLRPSR